MTSQGVQRSRPVGRPRRGSRPPLSREQVIQEALRFIDQEGLPAMSMRKLAHRLDVEAMSLYAHVASKDDLLNAVADQVLSELVLPDVSKEDWQERLRALILAWVGMQRKHPHAFPLIYRDRPFSLREGIVTEEIMDALAMGGLDPPGVALAYQTLVSFLDGALLSWPNGSWNVSLAWKHVEQSADSKRFARIAEVAPHAMGLSWEDVFYNGLDLFMHGFKERAHKPIGAEPSEAAP